MANNYISGEHVTGFADGHARMFIAQRRRQA